MLKYLLFYRLRNSELNVTVENQLHCTLGNKGRSIKVHVTPDVQIPTFKNDGGVIVFMLPSSYSVMDTNNHNHLKG